MKGQRKTGALLGYANIIAKNLVNIIYVPLLLHFIGQADYGVFQMTNSVVFALTLLSAGFYGSYVRFYMREKTRGNRSGHSPSQWHVPARLRRGGVAVPDWRYGVDY